ncbi:MAG: energy transducer TonB [Sphingomicrobium sp.]
MLAYAANRPIAAARRSSPHTFLLVASVHVIAIAALVSVKMDLPSKIFDPPIVVVRIPLPPVEVPPPPARDQQSASARSLAAPEIFIPGANDGPTVRADEGAVAIDPPIKLPPLPPLPPLPGISRGPALDTPAAQLKPPYPADKLLLEEEASLSLKLSIDESGRVVAVEPIGRADRSFVEAARRHLIAHWRYRPALNDGRAVRSTLLTTLHFRLDG